MPELLEVDVVETVHGRAYVAPAVAADITTLSDVTQVALHRDREAVPGGLSFLPGNRNVAFYPRRDYGYGGNVTVAVRYDGAELGRFAFAIRPMPTLVEGFVSDENLRPLQAVEVRLAELGISTMTDARGYYSFGFGTASDAILGGSYRLQVNPGWRNRNLGQVEQWVNAQEGQLTGVGLSRLLTLAPNIPTVEIRSGHGDVRLANSDLTLDLTNVAISFPDGRDAGIALGVAIPGLASPHRAVRHAMPSFGYVIQPSGIAATGAAALTAALPTRNGNHDYLEGIPEWVLIVGLDPIALELVPVGVGRIDPARKVIESRGALVLGRLDFIGFQLGTQPQQALEAFAGGQTGLAQLNSAVGGAGQ
jgi:hypothetical protein